MEKRKKEIMQLKNIRNKAVDGLNYDQVEGLFDDINDCLYDDDQLADAEDDYYGLMNGDLINEYSAQFHHPMVHQKVQPYVGDPVLVLTDTDTFDFTLPTSADVRNVIDDLTDVLRKGEASVSNFVESHA